MPDSVGATLAFDLIEHATNFFNNEGERMAALRPTLRELLVGNSHRQTLVADESGGAWAEEHLVYPIVGIGGGPGFGGDPFLQSLIGYSKALAQNKVRSPSCQPYPIVMPQTVSPIP